MNNPSNKKAVHVKWAGKTIALGTFPLAEADEKCARAKALTRAWRSTMRPKPSREWVMAELERLNVRVVSGRPSRELNGSDDDVNDNVGTPSANQAGGAGGGVNGGSGVSAMNGAASGGDMQGNSSLTTSLLNAAEIARGLGIDANAILNQQRRNSSLAMSLLDNDGRDSNVAAAVAAINKSDTGPHHRPLVGGGSAAAYEAARADFYRKLSEEKNASSRDNLNVGDSGRGSLTGTQLPGSSRRLSSLSGLFNAESSNNQIGDTFNSSNGTSNNSASNSGGGSGGGGSFGLSVNPNAHYEMLKLHHMNLLNEIQETTLMMNLYQQQQLQQRQQQKKLEQEQAILAQQQLLGQSMGRSNSLGLGNFNTQTNNSIPTNAPAPPPQAAPPTNTITNSFASKNDSIENTQQTKQEDSTTSSASELNDHEKQLQKIKKEIEERQRQLEELNKAATASSAKVVEADQAPKLVEADNNDNGADGDDDGGDDGDDDDEEDENQTKLKKEDLEHSNGQINDISEPPMKKTKIAV